jgi:Ulp1 family protease
LTDTVVNSYMRLLSKKYDTKNQIGFADSFFIWKLQCDRQGTCKFWVNGIGAEILDSHKKFLVSGHKGSCWILIEVDFDCSSMTIYDSFGK